LDELRRYGPAELQAVRSLLIDVYAEVYADQLKEPFHSVADYSDRLNGYSQSEKWETVVGYTDGGEPVGYAFGVPLAPGSRWWRGLDPEPTEPGFTVETGDRTFGLNEIMVRRPWRGTGAAHRIHEELLAHRPEQRASLYVEHSHPRVRSLYEHWGYDHVGSKTPAFEGAPLCDVLVRDPVR
jgi:GNAT superfamily N-acetyltransferase